MSSIYQGARDASFYEMIRDVLKRGKLTDKYIQKLLDEEGKKVYDKVFTHKSANEKSNYEYFETLGDVTVNKSIIWFYNDRFPKLSTSDEGSTILSKIKMNIGSKDYLYKFGTSLGFWNFISISEEKKQRELKKTLEDVFEAFMGATELLINKKIFPTAGYSICYNIMSFILKDIPLSLRYEDLADAITRLKEMGDKLKQQHITFRYQTAESKTEQGFHLFHVTVIMNQNGREIPLGQGVKSKKKDASQEAAENSIRILQQKYKFQVAYPNWEQYYS